MPNLLDETKKIIAEKGHSVYDVHHVVVGRKGKGIANISWKDFKDHADFWYDSDYGGVEIELFLKVVFKNGDWLEREEYDGAEWWVFRQPEKIDVTIEPWNGETMNVKSYYPWEHENEEEGEFD